MLKVENHCFGQVRHFLSLVSVNIFFKFSGEKVGLAVTRLFNNVTRIFGNKFKDNPTQTPRVDRKLRRKIIEKEQAHGIKH